MRDDGAAVDQPTDLGGGCRSRVRAVAWPFAVAAGLAHAGLVSRGRPTGRLWPEGAVVVVVTYAVGMLLRAVSGRGLAPGFLVVAGIFLALTMLGWRGAAYLAARGSTSRASGP